MDREQLKQLTIETINNSLLAAQLHRWEEKEFKRSMCENEKVFEREKTRIVKQFMEDYKNGKIESR